MNRIHIIQSDITQVDVDAIVNAANEWMLGGGGVDGAIHDAAGPELLEACRAVPLVRDGVRCPTGESRLTPGFRLSARYVIHTVGPVWRGGTANEAKLLGDCYKSALELASEHQLKSIAFPAIGCGAFGFPALKAAKVVHDTLTDFLADNNSLDRIVLVAIDSEVDTALKMAFAS